MSTPLLSEAAPAKVNLFLHVIGRRSDGYHLLDSLVVFAGVGDRLTASAADRLTLGLRGPFAEALGFDPDNLVLRAARELAAQTDIVPAARLILDKQLPVAAGLGGGSADAAAALRLLMRLWSVKPEAARARAIAESIGADVPVCLACRPARMEGIGERLAPAPGLPSYGLVLVNPGTPLSTADVFRGFAEDAASGMPVAVDEADMPRRWPTAAAMAADLAHMVNHLEPPAIRLRPVIGEVLRAILRQPGCLLARMSGSGASSFGLFPNHAAAETAARSIRTTAPAEWWIWGGSPDTRTRPSLTE